MEYIKLKDICDLKNGYAFKSSDYVEKSDVLNCRMSNIRPNATFDAEYNPKYLPNDYAEKYKEYLLYDGDLIIAMTDLANDPKILGVPTIVYTNGYKMLLNQRVGKLLLLNERPIKKKYLKYALSVPQNRGYFKKFAGGGVQINIGKAEILNIDIPYCNIETQNKIVEILDKAQSLIDKKKEQIELLDELIKSRFIDMFGDPVINNKNWETVELRYCIQEIKYGTSTPPNFSEQGIPFIRATNIKEGRIVENDMKYISEEEAKKIEKCKLSLGDTIIVRSGANTGDNTFVPEKYVDCYGGYDIIVKLNEKINYRFLNVLLNSVYREVVIQPLTRRAGQPHLNSEQIQSLMVYLPPIELQNEFAEFVTQTDSIRSKMETSLSELEDNFNSLMQKAFKGELF